VLSCEVLESRVLFAAGALPRPDHIVIVVEENHSYEQLLAPRFNNPLIPQPITAVDVADADSYIRLLAKRGASLTDFHAETHPSEPNYLALFSGSTQGVSSDSIPKQQFAGPSLGGELIAAGLTFAGYSEDLPAPGSLTETSGDYARKHNPWSDFADVPPADNVPLSSFPKKDFTQLPTVSFVVPNQLDDMHSGSVRRADQWLYKHLHRYERWARKHNSLLVVTWDEGSGNNHIPTIVTGAGVKRGNDPRYATHYDLLRTIQDMYGLPPLANSASAQPLGEIFR
jgi:hypothetical protein